MRDQSPSAIVIGASAGAVETLSAILPLLPADYPLPIIIVVHIPPDKQSLLPELMRTKCSMTVREAEDKENIEGGVIYFCPPDYHLLVEKNMTLSLSSEEPVLYSRPSIDVLFETAADAYEAGLIGIILSGANSDGAKGLLTIKNIGGDIVIQNPDLSYASAMPRAALELCPQAKVLSPEDIALYLKQAVST